MKTITQLEGLVQNGFDGGKGVCESLTPENETVKFIRPILKRYLTPSNKINRNISSYQLKHKVEHYTYDEKYVSNGELIYAMALDGYDILRIDINCNFNLYSREYTAFCNASIILKKLRTKNSKFTLQNGVEYTPTYHKYKYNLKYLIERSHSYERGVSKFIVPVLSKELDIKELEIRNVMKLKVCDVYEGETKIIEKLAQLLDFEIEELVNNSIK